MGSIKASDTTKIGWVAFGASVRGTVHLRRNQPNQDAIAWSQRLDPGGPVAVAVADGHGSERHPRSADGARLAVEIAVAALETWLREAPDEDDGEALPLLIQDSWQAAVERHLAAYPVEEYPPPEDFAGYLLYGTTLLAAGTWRGRSLCLQIGDGDILALHRDGTLLKPLPESPDCFDNITDSLCQEDAADRFRIAMFDEDVVLLLLATDGYGNSYEDDAAFEEIGPDFLALLNRSGADLVAAGLPGWLAEITRTGSGDDITLGLLWVPPEPPEIGG